MFFLFFFQCVIEVTALACSSSSREICEVSHNFGASLLPRQLCVRMRERQVDVDVAVPHPHPEPTTPPHNPTPLRGGKCKNHSAMLHFNLLALNVFKARAACSKL